MNAQDLQGIIGVLQVLIGKISGENADNIADGVNYSKPEGFYLYVGVEGDVTFTDMRGVQSTKNLVTGYHPFKMQSIVGASTTATDLLAIF